MSWASAIRQLAELGLTEARKADRQWIAVANLAAAVIAISSSAFAVIFALHGQQSLKGPVLCNGLLAIAATVLLIDIVEFVRLSNELGPERTVALLDDVFTRLDAASARFGVEKIKTIGDAYLAAAGVPSPHPNGEEAAADFGFHALHIAEHVGRMHGVVLRLRMGMASGSVTAGVLGRTRYAYDIWGAPVNMAARLEALGDPGCILTTRDVKAVLDGKFAFEAGEVIDIKGFGDTETWRMSEAR